MSAEENIALVRRFLEARAEGDLDAMDEIMAPDLVQHTQAPGQHSDRESVKRAVAQFSAAFSDVRFVIEELLAAGEKVVSRVSGRGTHDRSELMGVAPTGTEVASMAIFIHRIEGGKIVEEWGAGTGLSELRRQRLEQERIERERIEQELQVARSIQQASLPKEVPTLEGWQITPFYQPIAVEQDAPTLFEGGFSLLIAHPWHKPKRHPSGPKFLGLTVTMQVRQVVACVGVAQGSALGVENGVETGYEHVGGDVGGQRVVDPFEYLSR